MNTVKKSLERTVSIAIVEDHKLFRRGFVNLLETLDKRFYTLFEANNGLEFIEMIPQYSLPDIIITDLKMQEMNGFKLIEWLNIHHPDVPVIALTSYGDDSVLLRLIALGVKGVLYKGNDEGSIIKAFDTVLSGGSYFAKLDPGTAKEHYIEDELPLSVPNLSERMNLFAEKLCKNSTLEQVADEMNISFKTAERYRAYIFKRFRVKSRIEFVFYAIKNRLVKSA